MEIEYNALGNVVAIIPHGKGIHRMGESGRVQRPRAIQVGYVVDASGRRIVRTVAGRPATGYLYLDSLNPVAELDSENRVVSIFVYGERLQSPSYVIKDGTVYRIIADHLGGPRLVVDVETGQVAQRMDYDIFGKVTHDSNPGFQPFGFAGGLYDPETGLVRFGRREYDAETGRWLIPDPIGFGGGNTNLYLYALGDPVNRIDPAGTVTAEDAASFAAGVGDSLMFGATDLARELLGGNAVVDPCSTAYQVGGWLETVAETAASLGGKFLRSAAARASRRAVRNASRRVTRHIARNGRFLHHRLSLFGHPGGVPALFPTAGLPAWLHSGWLNRTLVDRFQHTLLHRRLRTMENILRRLFSPKLTLLRFVRLQLYLCPCK